MTASPAVATYASRPSARRRLGIVVTRWLLPLYAIAVTAYLILPVAVMILFSFNDPTGRSNLNFRQFSKKRSATAWWSQSSRRSQRRRLER